MKTHEQDTPVVRLGYCSVLEGVTVHVGDIATRITWADMISAASQDDKEASGVYTRLLIDAAHEARVVVLWVAYRRPSGPHRDAWVAEVLAPDGRGGPMRVATGSDLYSRPREINTTYGGVAKALRLIRDQGWTYVPVVPRGQGDVSAVLRSVGDLTRYRRMWLADD